MLILLSPAKTLDESKGSYKEFTQPKLLNYTKELIEEFKKYSSNDIEKLMKVSKDIAKLNVKRFNSFKFPFTLKNSKQAIFSFKGTVYRDIDVNNYSKEEIDFLQNHLRILSGLYGVLKPLDLIQPYRLEMHLKTNFWKDKVTAYLNQEKDETILNLASQEYFSAASQTNKRIISPQFKELKNGEYKIIAIYAKFARGTMTNWIIKNKITSPDEIKNFSEDDYKFNEKLSTNDVPVFLRG